MNGIPVALMRDGDVNGRTSYVEKILCKDHHILLFFSAFFDLFRKMWQCYAL